MFREIERLKDLLEGPSENSDVKIDSWKEFLKSSKCATIKKKLKKYESKYMMFHENEQHYNAL